MANICLIDDEKALNQVLKIYLERDGHSVVPYYCIQDIYKRTNWYSLYDLYIIDIMLPDGSGTELLKKIKDKNKYNYVYCMMNSTFAYWYWRLYDGGINCPLTIINTIPVFYDLFNENQLNKLNKIATEMQKKEEDYLVYKVNAGKKQENIKFPKKYRDEINRLFFEVLNINEDISILNKVHSSSLFEESESEDYE